MKITKRQLNKIIVEVRHDITRQQREHRVSMREGADASIWHTIQPGDLVDVDGDYNFYSRVRVDEKLNDVSEISGLPPGPGFSGVDSRGDQIAFSTDQVVPSSYEKYTFGEGVMKITKGQLRSLIRETVLREMGRETLTIADLPIMAQDVLSGAANAYDIDSHGLDLESLAQDNYTIRQALEDAGWDDDQTDYFLELDYEQILQLLRDAAGEY